MQELETIQAWLVNKLSERLEIDSSEIDIHETFASYGLSSTESVSLSGEIEERLDCRLSPHVLYDFPTIKSLSRYLYERDLGYKSPSDSKRQVTDPSPQSDPIAIIGIGCRFPGGVNDPQTFWQLLRNSGNAICEIPSDRWDVDVFYDPDPNTPGKMYVRHGGFLKDLAEFDNQFFSISPREAVKMDPQQRLLLEVSWEALENAGLSADELAGSETGVYIGNMNNHEFVRLQANRSSDYFNDPYFSTGSSSSIMSGRISYLFNFLGPSMTIDTACSSSLVAVHLGCQSLRRKEIDLALVGAVNTITLAENMISACKMHMLAADGRCKAFDIDADGFVLGEGCGVVILKRLSDAMASGDQVLAVIRGTAVNQDGNSNGITAPNQQAQQAVIRHALADGSLESHQLSYVEAHGSGTSLGDSIEVAALVAALFNGQDSPASEQRLVVGSVKTNIGHLAGAAGIAGLIKTVLALQHQEIPPHINLQKPNPRIAWASQFIEIPTERKAWPLGPQPRRAGVSSFGLGGTNAHVVLEEAPAGRESGVSREQQLLVLSARTERALEAASENLQRYLQAGGEVNLADVAYTLAVGRRSFNYRQMMVCSSVGDAVAGLEGGEQSRVQRCEQVRRNRPVVFMFPGLGEQYVGMGRELYESEASFRSSVDESCELLSAELAAEVRAVLLGTEGTASRGASASGAGKLDLRRMVGRAEKEAWEGDGEAVRASIVQSAVFVMEYALAQLWQSFGVKPQALIGYSLGEYVAATVSGVLRLRDALGLVVRRAELIESLPVGAMLAVALSETEVQPWAAKDGGGEVSVAAINGPKLVVLAGSEAAIGRVEAGLWAGEVSCRRVATSHALHTQMMRPLAAELTEMVRRVERQAPAIPYISNISGKWIREAEVADPSYWSRHVCEPVRYEEGLREILAEPERVLLEVGPGLSLSSFARQHPDCSAQQMGAVVSSVKGKYERGSEQEYLLNALGKLWLAGVEIEWDSYYQREQRSRVTLPTYPFERQKFWIDPKVPLSGNGRAKAHFDGDQQTGRADVTPETPGEGLLADERKQKNDLEDWFYVPSWKRSVWLEEKREQDSKWLILEDNLGVGKRAGEELERRGQEVMYVRAGESYKRVGQKRFELRPEIRSDYDALLNDLHESEGVPHKIVHLFTCASNEQISRYHNPKQVLNLGFHSLVSLMQALSDIDSGPWDITVVSSDMQNVVGTEQLCPEKATILGPCRVAPLEYSNVRYRSIDIETPRGARFQFEAQVNQLVRELTTKTNDTVVALRGNHRWVQTFEPVKLGDRTGKTTPLRANGVYLITGGLGGLGLAIAKHLAATVQAKLILVGRSGLPPRNNWPTILNSPNSCEKLAQRIRQVQSVKALGAEVLVLSADVTSEVQMEAAVREATATFGPIRGVVHAAGVPGRGLMDLKKQEISKEILSPKVVGTLVLSRIFRNVPLDFFVLFSSIVSVSGGAPGQVDYCAASAFLDAFAQSKSTNEGLTVSIDWGEWQWNSWNVDGTSFDREIEAQDLENRKQLGISFEEGAEAFHRVLSQRLPQVIVSTRDLHTVINNSKSFTISNLLGRLRRFSQDGVHFPRPSLGTCFVAPRNQMEIKIAKLWGELLGFSEVGIYDNFFELGGNSLLGIDLISRLREELQIQKIPAYVLYEAPSVSALADFLSRDQSRKEVMEMRLHRGETRRKSLGQRRRGAQVL